MKKLCIVILIAVCLILSSCSDGISPYELMSRLGREYPVSGVLYHSGVLPHESGYLGEELFKSVYIYSGDMPEDFAVYLNMRPGRGGECGAFSAGDAEVRRTLVSMCYERCRLVAENESDILVLTSGNLVFYSTLSDPVRARKIFDSIIK